MRVFPGTSSQFDGIIHYFNEIYKFRLYSFVDAYGQSSESVFLPRNVINESDTRYFHSDRQNTEQQYLTIHFKKNFIIPKEYSIKTYDFGPQNAHLKSWKIEGSTDNLNYQSLNKIEGDSSLNCENCENSFPINNVNQAFSYFRIKFIENHCPPKNSADRRILQLSKFELFGTITNRIYGFDNTFHCQSRINFVSFILFVIK